MRHVLGVGVMPVPFGAVAGIPLALLAARVLPNLLFEVSPLDARTFVLVPLTLVLVGSAAAAVPARRAAVAAPVRALRGE